MNFSSTFPNLTHAKARTHTCTRTLTDRQKEVPIAFWWRKDFWDLKGPGPIASATSYIEIKLDHPC